MGSCAGHYFQLPKGQKQAGSNHLGWHREPLASLDSTALELVSQDRLMLIPVFSLWALSGAAELLHLSLPSEMASRSPSGGLDSNLDLSPCLHLRSCSLVRSPPPLSLILPIRNWVLNRLHPSCCRSWSCSVQLLQKEHLFFFQGDEAAPSLLLR